MDDCTESQRSRRIAGIPADHGIAFFKRHAELNDPEKFLAHLSRERESRG